MKEAKKNNRGFTLMEMLIVVAIIAVLVAVAIPVLNNNLEKARQAVDMANARSIQAILATLVNTGEVVFPEKTNDTYAEGIGIWVLVVRDLSKIPQGYNKNAFTGNVYCGSEEGVLVNGESTVFNRQNSQIQKALAAMGSISSRSHSKGRKEGWDWYVVEYDYDPKTGEVRDYIYSGFSGDRSGIQTATRGSTNIAVAMSRKKK